MNKIKQWNIDEVLDPKSKFWDKIYLDVELYLDSLEDSEIEELGKDAFTSRIQDFLAYFKTLSPKNQKEIAIEINKTDEVIVDVLWNLIGEKDKEILFHNNIHYFNDWLDTCPQPMLDKYVNKLAKGESLTGGFLYKSSKPIHHKLEPKTIKDIINSSKFFHESCNVDIINGRIVLCSTNTKLLSNFKDVMLSSGNKLYERRTDRADSGIIVYSYVFEMTR